MIYFKVYCNKKKKKTNGFKHHPITSTSVIQFFLKKKKGVIQFIIYHCHCIKIALKLTITDMLVARYTVYG